jgi:hypothetical protein
MSAALDTVRLISSHPKVAERAALLGGKGVAVDASPLEKLSSVVGEMARLNPAILVLDLDKTPSRGREIAIALRTSKAARHIPILFVGGLPEKVERIRGEIPDVHFAQWTEAVRAMREMLKQPQLMPAAMPHRSYAATPLPTKLGIRARMQVALVGAPAGFEEMLGELPEGAALGGRVNAKTELALCFVRSWAELSGTADLLAGQLPMGASVWIVYPKRGSREASDLNENVVRDAGLGAGLVDYKVCAIDTEWSALKFAHRKK